MSPSDFLMDLRSFRGSPLSIFVEASYRFIQEDLLRSILNAFPTCHPDYPGKPTEV